MSLFEALQYRDYRIFWSGQVVSVMGFQMLMVTIGWLMYDITGSSVQLGLVGLSTALPAIVLNLFGGVVADKVNPKRLIMIVQSLNAVAVGIMATLVFDGTGPTLAHHGERIHNGRTGRLRSAVAAGYLPSSHRPAGDDERRGAELHDLAGQQNSWSRNSRSAHRLGWSAM